MVTLKEAIEQDKLEELDKTDPLKISKELFSYYITAKLDLRLKIIEQKLNKE